MKSDLEIMRVWRVPPMGKLVVEANGEQYQNLADVKDPKLRQRLMAAIGELVSFTGGYQALVDLGLAPALEPPPPPRAAEEEGEVSEELARQQEEFLARLSGQQAAYTSEPARGLSAILGKPARQPDVTPDAFDESGGAPSPSAAPPKPQSIAEQINVILQKHLAVDPNLSGRPISLEQSPSGSLRILVDGVYYDKPTNIPDKDVQLAIKMAVKEWNDS